MAKTSQTVILFSLAHFATDCGQMKYIKNIFIFIENDTSKIWFSASFQMTLGQIWINQKILTIILQLSVKCAVWSEWLNSNSFQTINFTRERKTINHD